MKLVDLSDYNLTTKIYWSILVAIGASIGVWGLVECFLLTFSQAMQFLILSGLIALTSSYPIKIPGSVGRVKEDTAVTLGDTFIFLGVLLFGVSAAVLMGALDSFASAKRTSNRRASWLGAPAIMAITVFVSGNAFYLTHSLHSGTPFANHLGPNSLFFGELLVPLVVMTVLQYLVNCFLVATFYAFRNKSSIWAFWRDNYLWTSWTFFASAIAAAIIYLAISHLGLIYVLLSVPIVGATYATYKIYFGRIYEKIRESNELARLHLATVEALATAIDAKDQTTHHHVQRLQIYSTGLGKLLDLTDREIEALKAGSLLHDIGKLGVPDHILNEPGPLGEPEREKMKMHTVIGAQILERVDFPYPVVPIVRHHHEWWNGNGYPDQLKGEEIPITARILSIADSFDSVREDRPHRRGMSRSDALAILLSGAGTQFDPKIVEVFLQNLPQFETQIAALGIEQIADNQINDEQTVTDPDLTAIHLTESNNLQDSVKTPVYLEQIKNAQREVYAFYQIARVLSTSLDIDDTLAILMNKIGNIVPFEACVIYLYDHETNVATAARTAGKIADSMQNYQVNLGAGLIGKVLVERVQISRSIRDLTSSEINLLTENVYCAAAVSPLVKGEQLLGVLAVYSNQFEQYSSEHLRLLGTVGKLASDALANSLHHAAVENTALTDALTGLPNARAMYLNFDQEVARAKTANQSFHVFMLDLDGFKAVNDTFGHKIGDRMLREAAGVIKNQLREMDFLARYAGDEFVAVVHNLTDKQAEELCERIETAVFQFSLTVRSGIEARVGVSVGAALFKSDGETLDQLLIAADQAMYCVKAKHHEKRCEINFAEPTEMQRTLDLEDLHSSTIN